MSSKTTKPTANKKSATKKSPAKSAATKEQTPAKVEQPAAPAPAPVAAPATTAPAADTAASTADAKKPVSSFEEQMESCIKLAQTQVNSSRTLVSSLRDVKKAHDRETKDIRKSSSKKHHKANTNGPKKPATGFAKPCKISDELADFLSKVAGNSEVKRGAEMSRTDVTKMLNKYFVEKGLRNNDDKRHIMFENDEHLKKLLPIPEGKKLTYFNLQKYLKEQFKPATPAAAPAAAPAATPATTAQ